MAQSSFSGGPLWKWPDNKGKRLWGGRFRPEPNKLMERINASIGGDQIALRLFRPGHPWASQAHAAHAGPPGPCEPPGRMEQDHRRPGAGERWRSRPGIHELGPTPWRTSTPMWRPAQGDHRSRRPAKLHTARSRNDQVATDLRLWVMDAGARAGQPRSSGVPARLGGGWPKSTGHVIMPGYTHLAAGPAGASWPTIYWPMWRWPGATGPALADCLGRAATSAPGRGRPGRDHFPHGPRHRWPPSWASRAWPGQFHGRGERPRLRGRVSVHASASIQVHLSPPGRGAGALVQPGVRLHRALPDRLHHRQRPSCPRRRTRTRPSLSGARPAG